MFNLFISLFIFFISVCHSQDNFHGCQQLVTVIVPNWDTVQGVLQRYERNSIDEAAWIPVGESIPVVIGKNGIAIGIGLHKRSEFADSFPLKREGDGKSPAGIFTFGTLFGFADEMPALKMSYIMLRPDTEAVDDPDSLYYNQIVKRSEISYPDWTSSEMMHTIPLYEIGLVINHNYPIIVAGAGSAIFMHIWRGDESGTGGCTAMQKKHLEHIMNWLDRDKNPLIVQLPFESYKKLQSKWNLPAL